MYSSILFDNSTFSSADQRRSTNVFTPKSTHIDSYNAEDSAVSCISMEFKNGVYEIYRLMTCVSRHQYRAEALAQLEIEKRLLKKLNKLKGLVQ